MNNVAHGTYHIGELASRTGVTPDALRYYEKLGLLPAPKRTAGGFRLYAATTVDRLRFIKQAQTLGLTLREIRDLVSYQDKGGRARCRRVRDLLAAKLAELEAKLAELQDFRRVLKGYLEECEEALRESADAECPVVEDLGRSRR